MLIPLSKVRLATAILVVLFVLAASYASAAAPSARAEGKLLHFVTGEGLPSVKIIAQTESDIVEEEKFLRVSATTSADGGFLLRGLLPGRQWVLHSDSDGFALIEGTSFESPGEDQTRRLSGVSATPITSAPGLYLVRGPDLKPIPEREFSPLFAEGSFQNGFLQTKYKYITPCFTGDITGLTGLDAGDGLIVVGDKSTLLLLPFVRNRWFMPHHDPNDPKQCQAICRSNLASIHTATQQWAMVNRKEDDDRPQPRDLVGGHQFLLTTPHCPQGGDYTIGSSNQPPTCSFQQSDYPHTFDPQFNPNPDVDGFVAGLLDYGTYPRGGTTIPHAIFAADETTPGPLLLQHKLDPIASVEASLATGNHPDTNSGVHITVFRFPEVSYATTQWCILSKSGSGEQPKRALYPIKAVSAAVTLAVCQNNQRRIKKAIADWSTDSGAAPDTVPTWDDLTKLAYLGAGGVPVCPSGGTYALSSRSSLPYCSCKGKDGSAHPFPTK